MLEFNPFHVLVACIFLAAKTEKGKGQPIVDFFHQFMSSVDEKDQEYYLGLILEKDSLKALVYKICTRSPDFDDFSYLKALEIEVCRAINFEFFVHNPLTNIHFM